MDYLDQTFSNADVMVCIGVLSVSSVLSRPLMGASFLASREFSIISNKRILHVGVDGAVHSTLIVMRLGVVIFHSGGIEDVLQ